MVRSALVFAEAGRPSRSREGTAMDELAGVPALTLSPLPRNEHLLTWPHSLNSRTHCTELLFWCLSPNPSAYLCLCLSPYRYL